MELKKSREKVSINVRPLVNHINCTKFERLIATLGYKPNVIGITETWESTSCQVTLKYRVSIKSLYNLKKLLQSEMMRYRNEGCFMLISIS